MTAGPGADRRNGPRLRAVETIADGQATPCNPQAEQGLLGALLLDNRLYDKVSEYLKAEHFHAPVHGRIYDAIGAMVRDGRCADAVTLKYEFLGEPDLEDVGGAAYLADLLANVPSALAAEDYARVVLDMARRRKGIEAGQILAEQLAKGDKAVDAEIEAIEQALSDLSAGGPKRNSLRSFAGSLADLIGEIDPSPTARAAKPPRILTGLGGLDKRLGGLEQPSLVIIGARPSMGKTALALTIAANVALSGRPVLFNSIETKASTLAAKVIARRTGLSVRTQRDAGLSESGFIELVQATQALSQIPLYIDDSDQMSLAQIVARASRLKRDRPDLALMAIDYLGLMDVPETGRNYANDLGAVTRGLKRLAKRLNIVVVLLVQLSRKVEERDNKRPQLSDLRDSGSIEADADIVLFPYRHEYYLQHAEPRRGNFKKSDAFDEAMANWRAEMDAERGLAEIIVAKCKDAERGTEKMRFDGVRQVFEDFGAGQEPQDAGFGRLI